MRLIAVVVFCAAGWTPALAHAQAFGIGGRMSMIRSDVAADAAAERFTGGHIRARISPRTALEIALDRRTEIDDARTERLREYPLQGSLLLFPVRTPFAPYVLGGGGWYMRRLDILENGNTVSSETTRNFGWHGGFGAELRLGRHAAAHADYRYTHLRFNDDNGELSASASRAKGESGLSRLLPAHKGSMWTAGLTVFF